MDFLSVPFVEGGYKCDQDVTECRKRVTAFTLRKAHESQAFYNRKIEYTNIHNNCIMGMRDV